MTMFDEATLANALRDAGDSLAVSDGAIECILDVAQTEPPRTRSMWRPSMHRSPRGGRFFSLALAAAVVLGIALPLFAAESSSPVSNFAQKTVVGYENTPDIGSAHSSPGDALTASTTNGASSGQVSATGTGFTVTESASALAATSSLRVEAVGTVDLRIRGSRLEADLSTLAQITAKDGGFVSSTRAHVGNGSSQRNESGSAVLEVPNDRFQTLVEQVRGVAQVTSVVTSTTDVTGQYVDLQARINALQVSRAQYLRIMTRTSSISGILSVQNQLDNIQSQIEQLQGQLNVLAHETTYATLTVSLSQASHQVNAHKGSSSGIGRAWHDSVHGFVAGFEWLIRLAGPVLFALLCLGALFLLGRLAWRGVQRRRA